MGDKLNISAQELRASGGAADSIARDLEKPLEKAMRDARNAGEALRHWTVGTQLASTETGWSEALAVLKGRLEEHGDGLRLVADGHDINEEHTSAMFQGW